MFFIFPISKKIALLCIFGLIQGGGGGGVQVPIKRMPPPKMQELFSRFFWKINFDTENLYL